MNVVPVVLEGQWVRLEPTGLHHASALASCASPETFQYFVTGEPPSYDEAGLSSYISDLLAKPDVLSFAVIDLASGSPVGMTSYLNIQPQHRGLEVGMTWYSPLFRGTRVNPEAKLLLIDHAFALGAVRVQLKTDLRNVQSQRAIEKLGAVREGVLRHHMIFTANGYVRDTVMYSILPEEWPAVREGLLLRLA